MNINNETINKYSQKMIEINSDSKYDDKTRKDLFLAVLTIMKIEVKLEDEV